MNHQLDPIGHVDDINRSQRDKLVMADSSDHLFWFLQVIGFKLIQLLLIVIVSNGQISDLHLSVNFDPTREHDFEKFCTEIIGYVKPPVVLATGDITDARTKGAMGSRQYEHEWFMYQDVINRTGVLNKTLWLDLRGNHDAFGVNSFDSDNNFFSKYSVQVMIQWLRW